LCFSLLAFAAFRLRDGVGHYFSVHHAIAIAKAVVVAELLTCVVLFTFTCFDDIPRSTPIIHALVLSLALVPARALSRGGAEIARKHVIIIGVSHLTSTYTKFLNAIAPGAQEIIAVLDDAGDSWGRSVNGVRIMGPPSELESIIEEFAVQGVRTDRVVAGVDPAAMPEQVLAEIRHVCAKHRIELGFIPEMFGLTTSPKLETRVTPQLAFEASLVTEPPLQPAGRTPAAAQDPGRRHISNRTEPARPRQERRGMPFRRSRAPGKAPAPNRPGSRGS
jgi:FlaA1/EpsC-like NDP-sugar epimerase